MDRKYIPVDNCHRRQPQPLHPKPPFDRKHVDYSIGRSWLDSGGDNLLDTSRGEKDNQSGLVMTVFGHEGMPEEMQEVPRSQPQPQWLPYWGSQSALSEGSSKQ